MTKKVQAASTTQLHDGNDMKLKVEQGDTGLENSQDSMMLIEPGELESGNTHSQDVPKTPGDKKAPTMASAKKPVKANGAMSEPLVDKEVPKGAPGSGDETQIAQLPNEEDPSEGYLEKEAGMPVLNNASVDNFDEDEFGDEATDVDAGTEFDDLATMGDGDEEFENLGTGGPDESIAEIDAEAPADIEEAPVEDFAPAVEPTADELPLLDVDAVPDNEGTDALAFACVAGNVLVLRKDRVIASMGPTQAKKMGFSDIYEGEQFQEVTANAIDTKGLRKGLVQQGFVLAKVRMTANAATAKVVAKKVEAGMKARNEALSIKDRAMEQSLAIAAVGINKKYFKNAENPLKAALITELAAAGVRNAAMVISSAFTEHGIGYAKSILTLANKLAAMPEEVRDEHANALDMTSDEDFDDVPTEVESGELCEDEMGGEEEFENLGVGASVTAALSNPTYRKYPGALLSAKVKMEASSHDLLFGDRSFV